MQNQKLTPAWIKAAALTTMNVSVTLRKIMSIRSRIAANRIDFIVSALFGLVACLMVMHMSWQHNPQCEIHCEGVIYWGYWLGLGLSAFVPVSLVVFGLIWLFSYVKNT